MTTKSIAPIKHSSVWRSGAVLHAAAAITGLIMILFLLAHMYGNLKIFAGKEALDGYSHHLRTIGEPILPESGALWIIRIVLLLSVVIHIYAVVTLWQKMRVATGGLGSKRYASTKNPRGVQRSYASFTMRWGGVIVGLFVVYHLLHLTANVIAPGGASASPYERMINGFSIWWVFVSYAIALIALGFHLRHGFWAAMASLGTNTSDARRRIFNLVAVGLATIITVGFLIPPAAILFGWVGQ